MMYIVTPHVSTERLYVRTTSARAAVGGRAIEFAGPYQARRLPRAQS